MNRRTFISGLSATTLLALSGKIKADTSSPAFGMVPHHRGLPFTASKFNRLWHLPQHLFADVHERVTGEGVKIAVLDTGIKDHTCLPKPVAYRSFVGGTVVDRQGHGTHVAGTALGRNGIGVAPGAELIVGKVLGDNGSGSAEGICDAIHWAVERGADVINLSLGGGYYPDFEKAVQHALDNNVFVVCAAGNAGNDYDRDTMGWPANIPGTIAVGATKGPFVKQSIASFSSSGKEMDIATCGQEIVSCSIKGPDKLVAFSGTSMATPYMAGVLALCIQARRIHGGTTPLDHDAFVTKGANDAGKEGHDFVYGAGILDIEKLLSVYTHPELLKD